MGNGVVFQEVIMLVIVLSLEIVLVWNDDFGILMKANKDGGVGIYTSIFVIHLESSSCTVQSFWYIYSIACILWELLGGM